jgi:hypothetical protein
MFQSMDMLDLAQGFLRREARDTAAGRSKFFQFLGSRNFETSRARLLGTRTSIRAEPAFPRGDSVEAFEAEGGGWRFRPPGRLEGIARTP